MIFFSLVTLIFTFVIAQYVGSAKETNTQPPKDGTLNVNKTNACSHSNTGLRPKTSSDPRVARHGRHKTEHRSKGQQRPSRHTSTVPDSRHRHDNGTSSQTKYAKGSNYRFKSLYDPNIKTVLRPIMLSRRPVTRDMIEVVKVIAPDMSEKQIEYDLQRTGNIELTVSRYLRQGTLPVPPKLKSRWLKICWRKNKYRYAGKIEKLVINIIWELFNNLLAYYGPSLADIDNISMCLGTE